MSEKEKEKDVQLDEKQLATGNEMLHALTPYGPSKLLHEMTRRIMIFDTGKIPMNANEAAHTAQLCLSTGLNIFAGEMFAWIVKYGNKREFKWMPGRLGLTRHANEQAQEMGIKWNSTEPELLTQNEKAQLVIASDSLAVRVKIRDDVSMASYNDSLKLMTESIGAELAYKELGPPPASVGIGVLTSSEMKTLDKSGQNKMPHINRCAKRARTEGLKGKFNLQYGGGVSGAPADYSEYLHGETLELEFAEVEGPVGLAAETFGDTKTRMNPKYWGDIPEMVVEADLARDKFKAAEILAYTFFPQRGVKDEMIIEFFTLAKSIYAKDEKQELKVVAEEAYKRLFAPKKKKQKKKTAPKKKEPKKETKKEPPKKPEVKLNDDGLTKNEKESLGAMAKDYARYTPKHNQDWNTAYKYINLKKVTTTKKEFQAIVKLMKGDVRLGMCRMLGYL